MYIIKYGAGNLKKFLKVLKIVDNVHILCKDKDGLEYYLGLVYEPNESWVGKSYYFDLVERDYATYYTKNLLGDFTFLYSLDPIPTLDNVGHAPMSFIFFLNIKTGKVMEITQDKSNFVGYTMGDRFDIFHNPSYKALIVYPGIVKNESSSLTRVTVTAHQFYYTCETDNGDEISVHCSTTLPVGLPYYMKLVRKYMSVSMHVSDKVPQPSIEPYTLGLSKGKHYTNALDRKSKEVLIKSAGIELPSLNIGKTIKSPSYKMSYMLYTTLRATTDKNSFTLQCVQNDFVSGNLLLFFTKGNDIVTCSFPNTSNLNSSIGGLFKFDYIPLYNLISMKLITDKDKDKCKDKSYLLKSMPNETTGIFERNSEELCMQLGGFVFGSSSISKKFTMTYSEIRFVNSVSSVEVK